MKDYIPYTYHICWTDLNLHYYGSRTAKVSQCLYETGCHPDEFWKTYFTSSEEVQKIRDEFGDPDLIEIRKTFPNNPGKCLSWEGKVLNKIKPTKKQHWLNQSNLSGVPNSWMNVSEEDRKLHSQRISESRKGIVFTEEHLSNLKLAKLNHNPDTSYVTEEWKEWKSAVMKDYYSSLTDDERKEKARVKVMTQEEKNQKVSDGVKKQWENKKKDVCPNCGFETFFLKRHIRSCK